jgi:hypothetical protein
MDPYQNSLAYKLLAETPSESDQHQEYKSEWGENLRHRLGGLLVTLGQQMQASHLDRQMVFEDVECPAI